MHVSLAVCLAVVESDDDFICHAFVIVVILAVCHFTSTNTRNTACRFGMTGRVWYSKKGIAPRSLPIANGDGPGMTAEVFVEAAGLGRTFPDLRHNDFNVFHGDLPDIG